MAMAAAVAAGDRVEAEEVEAAAAEVS